MNTQGNYGYSNLCDHPNSRLSAELDTFRMKERVQDSENGTVSRLVFPNKTVQIHFWFEMVVSDLQALLFVDHPVMWKQVKHNSISPKSLMRYLDLVFAHVEKQ